MNNGYHWLDTVVIVTYYLAITGFVGITTQPHMVSMCATGSTERAGRVGQTYSSFVKRTVTIGWALEQVSRVYEILGAENNFVRVEKDGGHDFPPDIKEEAFLWIDKHLEM